MTEDEEMFLRVQMGYIPVYKYIHLYFQSRDEYEYEVEFDN
jgi:hypothetical protein